MDKEIDFSSLNDKSFGTREEAVDALTELLEDNNFKKRECADNELAVAGTGSTRTQVSARHNANDIKSPNTGFGSGSEMAILLIVIAVLAIITAYLVKFSKKSSKIFNFVLAGFMAVFMSTAGLNKTFAQDAECEKYKPHNLIYATVTNYYGYFTVKVDVFGNENAGNEFRDGIVSGAESGHKAMEDDRIKYIKSRFNEGLGMFASDINAPLNDDLTSEQIFDSYDIPDEERTFEKILTLPVWYDWYNKKHVDYPTLYETGLKERKKRAEIFYEEFKSVNDGKYPGQIFIRDAEAMIPMV